MSGQMKCSVCPHISQMADFSMESIVGRKCCQICGTEGPNLWVCVTDSCNLLTACGEGVADHSTEHYRLNPSHRLTLNSTTFRIWCYECQTEVIIDSNTITDDMNDSLCPKMDSNGHILANEVYVADITDDETSDEEEVLMDSQNKPRGLTGLQNLGNSCYMNAALQSLSNCPQLSRFMLDCHSYIGKPGIAKSYCRLIKEIWDTRRPSYVVPTGIAHGIKSVFPLFRGYTQQDAQEFLRCFLDQLHEELKESHYSDGHCLAHGNQFCIHTNNNNNNNMNSNDMNSNNNMGFNDINTDSETNSDADYETCDSGLSSEKSAFGGDEPDMNGMNGETSDHIDATIHDIELKSRSPSPTIGSSIGSVPTQSAVSNESQSHVQSLDSLQSLTCGQSVPSVQLGQSVQSGHSAQTQTPRRGKSQTTYRSIISDIFDGRILSSVQCLKCDNISTTRETFQDLSLPIPSREQLLMLRQQQQQLSQLHNQSVTQQSLNTNESQSMSASLLDLTKDNVTGIYSWLWDWVDWLMGWVLGPTVTLQDCLSAFFSADELRGDNMYSCEKCNKLRNGVKYSKVLQLPEILSIHLKRFRHELMYSSKISTHVSFPLEGLDMSSYMACSGNGGHQSSEMNTYDLVAVICHLGTAASGHYTAYALNQSNQVWYEFDDQYVTSVDPQQVANCDAYVLFYRKVNDEMSKRRARALELMRLSRTEPSLVNFYVSKQWVNRFNTFSCPGPITNCDFLCQHNAVDPTKAPVVHELCTIFSHSVWEYFQMTFGGGPVCTQLYVCQICSVDKDPHPTDRRKRVKHNKTNSSD